MRTRRNYVSYALQRRQKIESMRRPGRGLSADNPCDAQPILITSAIHHGTICERPCPICASNRLSILNYTYGEQLGQYSGRIKTVAELEEMETEFGEFQVFVVEVCPECGWNHLVTSYTLGDGVTRRPPRRKKTVEDIYG